MEPNSARDPRIEMLPCGISRGNNNIVSLIVAKMPRRGEFDFGSIYNSIPQEDFYNAHGHVGSWSSPVTGGVDVCFSFFKEEEFLNSTTARHKCRLTEKGFLLKEKGDYEKYVDFIISEKNQVEQRTKELDQLARRQVLLSERQVWINFWIAVGAVIAGVYYLLEINIRMKDNYPNLYRHILPFELTASGPVVLTSVLYLYLRYIRKSNRE